MNSRRHLLEEKKGREEDQRVVEDTLEKILTNMVFSEKTFSIFGSKIH